MPFTRKERSQFVISNLPWNYPSGGKIAPALLRIKLKKVQFKYNCARKRGKTLKSSCFDPRIRRYTWIIIYYRSRSTTCVLNYGFYPCVRFPMYLECHLSLGQNPPFPIFKDLSEIFKIAEEKEWKVWEKEIESEKKRNSERAKKET